jgi:hypothetical protein
MYGVMWERTSASWMCAGVRRPGLELEPQPHTRAGAGSPHPAERRARDGSLSGTGLLALGPSPRSTWLAQLTNPSRTS